MPYDLFFSYRRHDLNRARPLLDALASCGLRVFRDETAIDEGASITQEIREGIASSKLLLAFYSTTYPLSSACQEEIISAWLAAQRAGEPPQARVRIINPEEPAFDHIPAPLRDLKAYALPHDPTGLAVLAGKLRTHADSLEDGLSVAVQQILPDYHGMAPVHAPHFVGRVHELWELHAKLTGNRISIISGVYGQSAAQVRGLGGNGKSLLAREYALRFGPAYPGGVFWLNAYGHDDSKGALDEESRFATRQDQLRQFAVNFGVTIEGLKPDEIEAAFWRQLEVSGRPYLWIVDDVPSGITPSNLERYWFAPGSNASTLITTRSREYGSLGQQLDLGVLSPDEAMTLLTRGRRPENDSEEETAAWQLTEALGCHPLAIEVAGSYLAKVGNSFQEYLDELTDPKQDVLEYGALLRESLPTGHDRSITRTLLKSIELLGQEGGDFLLLASVLAVAPITTSFLQGVFEAVGIEKGIPETVLEALDQADSLSLCEKAGRDSRRVHSLVSRVVRFKLVQNDRIERLKKAAVGVLCRRLSVASDVREHPGIANEVAHGRHLTATGLVTKDEAILASRIARYDYERGDYAAARKLQEQALEVRGRLLGKEHPDTLTAMNDLAQALNAQGELAGARQLQEQVLEASARLLGKEHPDTLRAILNLAGTLYGQGELAGARQLQEQVLEASARLLGKEHPNTLQAMLNLAEMLYAQGDLAGARTLEEQALEARGRLLGKEHPDTLRAMNNLAVTLNAQGELAGARTLQEQVLEASARLLGKEHPQTLAAMNNLAQTLYGQGELAGARKLQEQVLEARGRLLGKEHSDTLQAMFNLAGTLDGQGELAGARKFQEQVLEAWGRLLGKEHPDTLRAMNNLAGTLNAQGELAGARKFQEQVLEALGRLLGKEHPNTLTAMNNLAKTLYGQGELAGARKLQEQVLEARGRLLGKEHPDTLTAMNNLAKTLKAEKDSARIVQAADIPSSQPSTKGRTGRSRMISNFSRLFGNFFRGSSKFRSKKTP